MRRALPPHIWLPPDDLEHDLKDGGEEATGLPQRIKEFSIGRQKTWGWMDELGTTEHAEHTVLMTYDWASY